MASCSMRVISISQSWICILECSRSKSGTEVVDIFCLRSLCQNGSEQNKSMEGISDGIQGMEWINDNIRRGRI